MKTTQVKDKKISTAKTKEETLLHIKKGLEKYQALSDSNMLGVAITDFQDTILNTNEAFLKIIGYTKKDLKNGKITWSKITPEKYTATDDEKVSELFMYQAIVPFEKEYIHKNGHTVPVLVGAEVTERNPDYGVCFALDISELKDAEQKKDDFIGLVSHEIKTPLAIVKLYSEALHSGIKDDENKDELLKSVREIESQIDKLNVLVTDLLNMARYQAAENTIELHPTEIVPAIQKTLENLMMVHKRTITFKAPKSVLIQAHKERILQIVTNLITNAMRYSDPASEIIVQVKKVRNQVEISVQDFGMGVSKENLKHIFERYYRINNADKYSQSGIGVGLYICKQIAEQHNGELIVKSVLGKGSTFTLSLPLIK